MLRIKSKEPLRGVPAGPLRRKRAQRGEDASAVERLRVGPERTAELDSRRNLDPGGGESEPLELARDRTFRSEEHTSELQSLMRISYAVFCLKKKKKTHTHHHQHDYPLTHQQ